MAIRFQCGSCSQPIEVDDQWASKPVVCPYCRKTITAPAQSDLEEVSQIPTASPLPPMDAVPNALDGSQAMDTFPVASGQTLHPNRIAVVAVVLAAVVLVLLISVSIVTRSHRQEIMSFYGHMEEFQRDGMGFFAAQQKALLQLADSKQGMPPTWMIQMTLLYMSAAGVWVATMVCALLGLRKPYRRSLAVAAIVLGGVVPLFFCCGGGMGLPGGAG